MSRLSVMYIIPWWQKALQHIYKYHYLYHGRTPNSWCISTPANCYSRVDSNEVPHGECGLHGSLPIQKADCPNSRQSSAPLTRLVYLDVQAYKAQSRVWIREEMILRIDRILDNISRSSLVSLCWLWICACLLCNSFATTKSLYSNVPGRVLPYLLTGVMRPTITLSRPHSPRARWSPAMLPIGYRVSAMCFEIITLLIQSGHPSIQADLNLHISQSYESVVGTSTKQVDDAYRLLYHTCRWVIQLCHRFNQQPTDTMPT